MTTVLILIVATYAWFRLMHGLAHGRRTGCRCGRQLFPYFEHHHERALGMGVIAAVLTVNFILGAAFADATGERFWAVLNGLITAFYWRRLYLHEKGKRRGALRRLLGRVGINQHGRLEVHPA